MAEVLHLLDGGSSFGVARALGSQLPMLLSPLRHRVRRVHSVGDLPGRMDADVVVAHFSPTAAKLPYLLALRLRARGRLVMVEHGWTEGWERRSRAAHLGTRTMLRAAWRLADLVVAVSPAQAEWMRGARLVEPARLVTIPQAVDVARLTGLGPPAPHAGPVRLGAYGRHVPQKGFDRLLAAMADVAPDVATLRIAGFGPQTAALRAAAAGLPHVTVEDQVIYPSRFLAEVDAVVVPSRWEAFGLVAMEAQAAGRPVIASAVDGLVDQVTSGTGLLADPDDQADLVRAIHALAAADRVQMGTTARAAVSGCFERTVTLWRSLLQHLASPPAVYG